MRQKKTFPQSPGQAGAKIRFIQPGSEGGLSGQGVGGGRQAAIQIDDGPDLKPRRGHQGQHPAHAVPKDDRPFHAETGNELRHFLGITFKARFEISQRGTPVTRQIRHVDAKVAPQQFRQSGKLPSAAPPPVQTNKRLGT